MPLVNAFFATFVAKFAGSAKFLTPCIAASPAFPINCPVIGAPPAISATTRPAAGVNAAETNVVAAAIATSFASFLAVMLSNPYF